MDEAGRQGNFIDLGGWGVEMKTARRGEDDWSWSGLIDLVSFPD
jgi:hypothetical protein